MSRSLWGLFIALAAAGMFAVLVAYLARNIQVAPAGANDFVSSMGCSACHADIHASWNDSLHRKMMRRVSEPDAVRAHWDGGGTQPKFSLHDAVWVIGSKWEQQFMGADDKGETMLPGAWSVALKRWTIQGWDGWQVPVPETRCHGCHVVGLDHETGHFVEPGIGCESCHGKGGWHLDANGRGPIHAGLDSETCGQCHSRGHATAGPYFFPVNYEPGMPLDPLFSEVKADFIQNSSQWWGNGRERDRHQEYPAWRRGGHANALKSLQTDYDGRFGPVEPQCLRCHSAEAAMNPDRQIGFADAKNGVTCAVCHNVHGNLEQIRTPCESCHDRGPFHHRAVAQAEHVPCPESANVGCVNCHMPITVKIGGELRLHSHAPGITPPEAGARFEAPSSCANGGCHQSTSSEQLQKNFERFYNAELRSAQALPASPHSVHGHDG